MTDKSTLISLQTAILFDALRDIQGAVRQNTTRKRRLEQVKDRTEAAFSAYGIIGSEISTIERQEREAEKKAQETVVMPPVDAT